MSQDAGREALQARPKPQLKSYCREAPIITRSGTIRRDLAGEEGGGGGGGPGLPQGRRSGAEGLVEGGKGGGEGLVRR